MKAWIGASLARISFWWDNLTNRIGIGIDGWLIVYRLRHATPEERLDFARELGKETALLEKELIRAERDFLIRLREQMEEVEEALRSLDTPPMRILAIRRGLIDEKVSRYQAVMEKAWTHPRKLKERIKRELSKFGHPEEEIDFLLAHGARQARIA